MNEVGELDQSYIKTFFAEYPEAHDILPVYSPGTLVQWMEKAQTRCSPLGGFDFFPSAMRELNEGHSVNLLLRGNEEYEAHAQTVAQKYKEMFEKRILALLSSVASKTQEERIEEILALRKEFFAYPVGFEASLTHLGEMSQASSSMFFASVR